MEAIEKGIEEGMKVVGNIDDNNNKVDDIDDDDNKKDDDNEDCYGYNYMHIIYPLVLYELSNIIFIHIDYLVVFILSINFSVTTENAMHP